MKTRSLVIIAAAVLVAAALTFQGSQDRYYTVEVAGTDGTPFSGNCSIMSGGALTSRDAAGAVPAVFQVSGTLVSCMVQNLKQTGELILSIKRSNGETVATSSTKQPYGVANIAGQ